MGDPSASTSPTISMEQCSTSHQRLLDETHCEAVCVPRVVAMCVLTTLLRAGRLCNQMATHWDFQFFLDFFRSFALSIDRRLFVSWNAIRCTLVVCDAAHLIVVWLCHCEIVSALTFPLKWKEWRKYDETWPHCGKAFSLCSITFSYESSRWQYTTSSAFRMASVCVYEKCSSRKSNPRKGILKGNVYILHEKEVARQTLREKSSRGFWSFVKVGVASGWKCNTNHARWQVNFGAFFEFDIIINIVFVVAARANRYPRSEALLGKYVEQEPLLFHRSGTCHGRHCKSTLKNHEYCTNVWLRCYTMYMLTNGFINSKKTSLIDKANDVRDAVLFVLVVVSPFVHFKRVKIPFVLDVRYLNNIFLSVRFCEQRSCTAAPRVQQHMCVLGKPFLFSWFPATHARENERVGGR